MKQWKVFMLIMLCATTIKAQSLYVQAYGDSLNPAVVFLHGGPGYNAATFEATTASALAASGFYVIVYDRRGEGRSSKLQAAFTFQETSDDLLQLCENFGLEKVAPLGHSFGGIVGTRFAQQHPEKVSALVLVSAPVDVQESFQHIIASCRSIYSEKNDTSQLKYIEML